MKILLTFLLLLNTSILSANDKLTYFGAFDIGTGFQDSDNSNEENKENLSYGARGFLSYDLEHFKLEGGGGWIHYKVKTDLSQGTYSAVKLRTNAPYLQLSPKYKLSERFLLGIEGNYIFDNGILLSPTEDTRFMAGLNLTYLLSTSEKFDVRTGLAVTRSLDASNRDLTLALLSLQFGFRTGSDKPAEPIKLKENQKVVNTVFIRTEHKITKVILDETLIHFETGKYDLDLKSKALLAELGAFLASNPDLWEGLEITGHTDYRGGDEYNTVLSVKRANSVFQELSAIQLPKDRVIFQGKGKNEPVASGDSVEDLAQNRRVELRFYNVSDKDKLMNYIYTLTQKYQVKLKK